jgi:hypothetical protein
LIKSVGENIVSTISQSRSTEYDANEL